jgi:hypothetical protein
VTYVSRDNRVYSTDTGSQDYVFRQLTGSKFVYIILFYFKFFNRAIWAGFFRYNCLFGALSWSNHVGVYVLCNTMGFI